MIWLVRIVLVLAGVVAMYVEGRHQPEPGIGFALAMFLFMAIPFTFKETDKCGG